MMVMHPIVRTASRAQRGSPAELERFTIELSLSVNCRPSTVKFQKATVNYQVKCSIGQQLPQLNSVWLSCRAWEINFWTVWLSTVDKWRLSTIRTVNCSHLKHLSVSTINHQASKLTMKCQVSTLNCHVCQHLSKAQLRRSPKPPCTPKKNGGRTHCSGNFAMANVQLCITATLFCIDEKAAKNVKVSRPCARDAQNLHMLLTFLWIFVHT